MQIFLKKLSILGLILIISACGFQLRGDIQANFDSISISGGTSVSIKLSNANLDRLESR